MRYLVNGVCFAALMLAGCGGDGGNVAPTPAVAETPPPAPPPPPPPAPPLPPPPPASQVASLSGAVVAGPAQCELSVVLPDGRVIGSGTSGADGIYGFELDAGVDGVGDAPLLRVAATNCTYVDEFSGATVMGAQLSAMVPMPADFDGAEIKAAVTPLSSAVDAALGGQTAMSSVTTEALAKRLSAFDTLFDPFGDGILSLSVADPLQGASADAEKAARRAGLLLASVSALGELDEAVLRLAEGVGPDGVMVRELRDDLFAAAYAFEATGRNATGDHAANSLGGLFATAEPTGSAPVAKDAEVARDATVLNATRIMLPSLFEDADGDVLAFRSADLPEGLRIHDGMVMGAPEHHGQKTFAVTAFDGAGHAATVRVALDTAVERHEITQGSSDSLDLGVPAPTDKPRSAHGNRFGCAVSHFSYDDPIVFPDQPGRAHLHQFTGSPSADAFSTPESLDTTERSTCQSGINNRSAYWSPAMFNESGEAMLPEFNFFYYKTFLMGQTPKVLDEGVVNRIPNGFQMLARSDTKNAGTGPFGVFEKRDWPRAGEHKTGLSISFPSCVAVDADGEPVLDFRDMPGDLAEQVNSHVAYPGGVRSEMIEANNCPQSHPYRIPTLQLKMYYDVPIDSGWYLASDDVERTRLPESDPDHLPSGHSLHADYFAMWDADTMDALVECVRIGESCNFPGQPSDAGFNSDGVQIYRYLDGSPLPEVDRTPFGDSLPPSRVHGGHGHGG